MTKSMSEASPETYFAKVKEFHDSYLATLDKVDIEANNFNSQCQENLVDVIHNLLPTF